MKLKKTLLKIDELKFNNSHFAAWSTEYGLITYIMFYFALMGVGTSIVASEIFNYYDENEENKDFV